MISTFLCGQFLWVYNHGLNGFTVTLGAHSNGVDLAVPRTGHLQNEKMVPAPESLQSRHKIRGSRWLQTGRSWRITMI